MKVGFGEGISDGTPCPALEQCSFGAGLRCSQREPLRFRDRKPIETSKLS
jgi:hypothetical protein